MEREERERNDEHRHSEQGTCERLSPQLVGSRPSTDGGPGDVRADEVRDGSKCSPCEQDDDAQHKSEGK